MSIEIKAPYLVAMPQYRTVLWYRQGQMNSEPLTSIVTKMSDKGVAHLAAFMPNSSQPQMVMGARHCDDPYCKTHPDAIREANRGCWAYLPVEADKMKAVNLKLQEKRVAEVKKAREADRKLEEQQRKAAAFDSNDLNPNALIDVDVLEPDEIIMKLTSAGVNATVIGQTLAQKTGEEWNHQRVSHRRKALQGNPLTNGIS